MADITPPTVTNNDDNSSADITNLDHTPGNATVFDGTDGNDILTRGHGDNVIDGGCGTDTVIYTAALSNFTLTRGLNGYSVRANGGTDGTDTVTNVESLKFSDMTVNLTVHEKAATVASADVTSIEELYVAFFNRIPDADGLSYWIYQLKDGQTINQIAESFYSAGVQNPSLTGYSSTMSNDDFVNVLYKNVLGRTSGAEAEGLAYWSNALADGSCSRGSLVTSILSSAHTFKGNAAWGWVADLLDNKIAVADKFAVTWGLNYNSSDDSITNGMSIAAAVTPTDTAAAITLIGISDGQINLG